MLAISIPTILLFYTFVEQSIYAKACICMSMTLMSMTTCYLNREIVFTEPHLSGPMVIFTNDMLITYFVIDMIHHIWKFKWEFRKDLIFHHIIIVIPFFIRPTMIGLSFPIMAEIYSTGAMFQLSPRADLKYRGFMIMTVRLFVWISLFRMSLLANQDFTNIVFQRIVSIGMLSLDAYWLKLIVQKLSKPE
jgi:hypothetical protein